MPTDNSSSPTATSTNSYLENCQPSTEPKFTGRKGIAYDWQRLLIPSDTVFEASLQTLLSSVTTDLLNIGDHFSPTTHK